MAADLPPNVPVPAVAAVAAVVPPAPPCRMLTQEEARVAFERLRARLSSTAFATPGYRPSEICGLAQITLARGSVAYTDATGRYFLLALALDTQKGGPADAPALDAGINQLFDEREMKGF